MGGGAMTYYIETFGCEYNIAESSSMAAIMDKAAFVRTYDAQNCDVVLMNTCSIRKSAEEKIEGHLGAWRDTKKRRGGKPYIIFTGCMAERLKGNLSKKYSVIDFLLGNFEKDKLVTILDLIKNATKKGCENTTPLTSPTLQKLDGAKSTFEKDKTCDGKIAIDDVAARKEDAPAKVESTSRCPDGDASDEYRFFTNSYEKGTFESFVPIIHGCNNFCTYCIVPHLRGREISRPLEQILGEIDYLSEQGVREITLLGQNVNSYNFEGTDFATLLLEIEKRITSRATAIKWVRFLSSHPKDLSTPIINAMRDCPHVAPALHLPLQSGSDKILRAMNRKYTAADYLLIVKKLRNALPNISLSTDIMTGFPGETDEDFEATLLMMDKVQYTSAMMYYYNERPGTKAALMEGVPREVRKARLEKVIAKQLLYTQEALQKHLGETLEVLIEHPSRNDKSVMLGKTAFNTKVAVEGAGQKAGDILLVALDKLDGNTYKGHIVR